MKTSKSSNLACCAFAFAAFAGGLSVACAQTASTTAPQPLNLAVPALDASQDGAFSSSSNDNGAIVAENHFDFVSAAAENAQPGQRRYGRPRYRGGNTNADGSSKYTFFAGAGITQPVGNTYHYNNPSYSFQVGAGRNFSRNVGLNFQFDWDNMGLNGRTLSTFSYIFTQDPNASDFGLDAHTHVWSFSLDPIYNLTGEHDGIGAYITGGAGFYHKNTSFTVPQQGCGYDYYGYYECYTANSSFPGGTYNSNAVGFNGGFGLTYKISRFSNEKFYVEGRYVVTLNSQRQGANLNNAVAYAGNNFYPANSNRTTYVPIKAGIRF